VYVTYYQTKTSFGELDVYYCEPSGDVERVLLLGPHRSGNKTGTQVVTGAVGTVAALECLGIIRAHQSDHVAVHYLQHASRHAEPLLPLPRGGAHVVCVVFDASVVTRSKVRQIQESDRQLERRIFADT
jgi:hypothetical protein